MYRFGRSARPTRRVRSAKTPIGILARSASEGVGSLRCATRTRSLARARTPSLARRGLACASRTPSLARRASVANAGRVPLASHIAVLRGGRALRGVRSNAARPGRRIASGAAAICPAPIDRSSAPTRRPAGHIRPPKASAVSAGRAPTAERSDCAARRRRRRPRRALRADRASKAAIRRLSAVACRFRPAISRRWAAAARCTGSSWARISLRAKRRISLFRRGGEALHGRQLLIPAKLRHFPQSVGRSAQPFTPDRTARFPNRRRPSRSSASRLRRRRRLPRRAARPAA